MRFARRAWYIFPSPSKAFPINHVIAYHWRRVDVPGKLKLENHQSPVPEAHLGACEIKLPHSHKPVVISLPNLRAVFEETFPPMPQRLCIVQTQDLHGSYP